MTSQRHTWNNNKRSCIQESYQEILLIKVNLGRMFASTISKYCSELWQSFLLLPLIHLRTKPSKRGRHVIWQIQAFLEGKACNMTNYTYLQLIIRYNCVNYGCYVIYIWQSSWLHIIVTLWLLHPVYYLCLPL